MGKLKEVLPKNIAHLRSIIVVEKEKSISFVDETFDMILLSVTKWKQNFFQKAPVQIEI